MHRLHMISVLLAACAAIPAPAMAQASAAAAPPAYDSAFASYQKYVEPQVADWKQTNAAIAATGAHAHGQQSAAPPQAPAAPHAGHAPAKETKVPAAQPAAPAKPDPHAGHNH